MSVKITCDVEENIMLEKAIVWPWWKEDSSQRREQNKKGKQRRRRKRGVEVE